MTVEQLIEILQTLPKDYVVTFDSGDLHGSAYLAYADEVEVKHKVKEVEIKE